MPYSKSSSKNLSNKYLQKCGVLLVCVLFISLMWVLSTLLAKESDEQYSKFDIKQNLTSSNLNLQDNIEPDAQQTSTKTKSPDKVVQSEEFLDQLKTPYGFSIEPFNNRLIWTSSEEATFKLANIDGTDINSIKTNFEEPYLLKIDDSFGHTLYFYAEGQLIRKEVDTQLGTTSESVLLDLGQQKVHGLGFDDSNDMLFFGDQYGQATSVIHLANDGSAIVKKNIPITPTTIEE